MGVGKKQDSDAGQQECRVVESCAKPDCHEICGWVDLSGR
jgi:hypothetical protein